MAAEPRQRPAAGFIQQAWVAVRTIGTASDSFHLAGVLKASQAAGCAFAVPPVPRGSKRLTEAQQHHHIRQLTSCTSYCAQHRGSSAPQSSQESADRTGSTDAITNKLNKLGLSATKVISQNTLPEDVWRIILAMLPTPAILKFGLVCRDWRDLRRECTLSTRLQEPRLNQIRTVLPNLQALDLSGCQNVRNRHLAVLSASFGRGNTPGLKRLIIGHSNRAAAVSPAITDEGLGHIGCLTTLTELRLASCNKITSPAVVSTLAALRELRVVAIETCNEVTDCALVAIVQRPQLTALTVVVRLKGQTPLFCDGDGVIKTRFLPPTLRSLHIGLTDCRGKPCTNMTLQGTHLSMFTSLTSLGLHGHLCRNTLKALENLGNLGSLRLSNNICEADKVCHLISCLPSLEAATLGMPSIGNRHLSLICHMLPELRELDVRGSSIAPSPDLTMLSDLTSLSITMKHISYYNYRNSFLPRLPRLARLTMQAAHRDTPVDLDSVLQQSALTYLNIGNPSSLFFETRRTHWKFDRKLPPVFLHKLYSRPLLITLDVSFSRVTHEEIKALLKASPQLRDVCIRGCPAAKSPQIAQLATSHPGCHVHTRFL